MTAPSLRVLILGGYGTFGGRLAELLADEPRLTLVIAGRSAERAAAFAATLPGRAAKIAIALDRDGDLKAAFTRHQPQIVVDATGPFQAYGARPYRVVEACLDLGINYLDLADGSDFVKGIAAFDERARAKGIFILSGVSSFPVLTAALLSALSPGFHRIDSVIAGIAPSPFAEVGSNVIRAITGYAGKPVRLWRDGKPVQAYGLTETRRLTIAPPGRLPLRSTLFALVDVPDLTVLHDLRPEIGTIWVGAGPRPEPLQHALVFLARLVRWRLLPALSYFAGVIHAVKRRLAWGEDRGGMFVSVAGEDEHGPLTRTWHLLAEGSDGPLIPSMACEAVIRHCLAGRVPEPGARAAAGALTLADYEALFARRAIFTGIREERPGGPQPLYRRLLGSAYDELPEPIRRMHELAGELAASGKAEVERGSGMLARLVGALMGFPPAGTDVPVAVHFRDAHGSEHWERSFAGRKFSSVQQVGAGRSERLLVERFGPMRVALALVVENGALKLLVRRWSLLGVPMPLFLGPRSTAYEHVADDRFRFHVEIGHPLTGMIVRYRGWLVPA